MVREYLKNYNRRLVLTVAMVAISAGCSFGVSHFDRSYDVANAFEQYELLPDHQYYYFGHPHSPDAVVGIRKGWTFQTTSWKPLEADQEKLKDIIQRMLNMPGSEYNQLPNGAYIYNDQKEPIGVWYSIWVFPILRFTDQRTFTISDPIPVLHNNISERNKNGIFFGD